MDEKNVKYNSIRLNEPKQKAWDYILYLLLSQYCERSKCITPKWENCLSNFYHQLSEEEQYQLAKKCLKLMKKYLFNNVPSEFWANTITIKLIHKIDVIQYTRSNIAIYDITHIQLESKDYMLSVSSSLFPMIMWNNGISMDCYLRSKHPSKKCKVSYDFWQMECCGQGFQVGDKVHWLVKTTMHDNNEPPNSNECNYSYEAHQPSYKNLEVLDGTVTRIRAVYGDMDIHDIQSSRDVSSSVVSAYYIIDLDNVTVKPATYLDFWNEQFRGDGYGKY